MKYSVMQISKLLEKIFKAGFNTEKKILSIELNDLSKITDLTSIEINILIDLKKAIKNKKIISFLSGIEEKKEGDNNVI